GAIDAGLAAAGALLRQLAQQIDAQPQDPQMRGVLQVRSVVEAVARDTLDRVGRALGPGPLCGDRVHAQRCADLSVFIRQHHGERDLQALGELCHQQDLAWKI
ncbi:acyl-CoA dehydrogenase, partial [Xanthomonas hortorum pv. pelargonii]|nr:acyl-CoA dehydrogenase [Xanthomonas hortorum pv. pelargonii]